jgi:hypothetical protein
LLLSEIREETSKQNNSYPFISIIFYMIGGLSISLGVIVGGYYIAESKEYIYGDNLKLYIGIVYCVGGFINGMLFIGIGKVIELLDIISKERVKEHV